jgi:hypothetical protein
MTMPKADSCRAGTEASMRSVYLAIALRTPESLRSQESVRTSYFVLQQLSGSSARWMASLRKIFAASRPWSLTQRDSKRKQGLRPAGMPCPALWLTAVYVRSSLLSRGHCLTALGKTYSVRSTVPQRSKNVTRHISRQVGHSGHVVSMICGGRTGAAEEGRLNMDVRQRSLQLSRPSFPWLRIGFQ